MPALSKDTRLVMTILFVGVMSGTNVWAYSAFSTFLFIRFRNNRFNYGYESPI